MEIIFYNNESDRKVLDKKIKKLISVQNVKFVDETNICRPKLLISRTFFDERFRNINYLYIDNLKRYYYINNMNFVGSMVEIICEVDVLMSYKTEIRNLNCTVKRNENIKNGYLNDDNYNVYSYENIVCKAFPKGLTDNSIILMTVG